MSKKKQKRADLKSAILVLLLIAILLIASTYAWFTANTTVTISTLDVKVQTQNGLQISADGTTWKTVLQNTDIDPVNGTVSAKYPTNVNQIPTIMDPVSTVGEMAADGTMNMFYGLVTGDKDGNYQLKATKETDTQGAGDTAGKYITFDTFLRVEEDTQLTLTASSNVMTKEGSTDKGLQNAARVAFCVLGNTTSGADLATIQGLNTGVASPVYLWEPNSDVHTTAGVNNAKDTYGITTTPGPGAAPVPYYGVKAPIDPPVALASQDTNFFATVTPTHYTKQTMEDIELLELKAGITKVRIYMWVEGQDVDCENSASGTDISYNVQFSIPSSTTGA